jgi:hypothetical protein
VRLHDPRLCYREYVLFLCYRECMPWLLSNSLHYFPCFISLKTPPLHSMTLSLLAH